MARKEIFMVYEFGIVTSESHFGSFVDCGSLSSQ